MASNEQRWVVQPDEVRIEIAIGREAKLLPEVKDALDRLAHVLEQQREVQGHKMLYDTAQSVIRKMGGDIVEDEVQGYQASEEEEVIQPYSVMFNCKGVW